MQTTYIVRRISETSIVVQTVHNGQMTSLFGSCDLSRRNMSGALGAWEGDFPRHASEVVAAAEGLGVGAETKITFGQPPVDIRRTYPADSIKAAAWDAVQNEGGDGYNPYR